MPAAKSLRLMTSRQHAKYNRNARGVLSRQRFNRTGSGVAIEQGGGETRGQFGEGLSVLCLVEPGTTAAIARTRFQSGIDDSESASTT